MPTSPRSRRPAASNPTTASSTDTNTSPTRIPAFSAGPSGNSPRTVIEPSSSEYNANPTPPVGAGCAVVAPAWASNTEIKNPANDSIELNRMNQLPIIETESVA